MNSAIPLFNFITAPSPVNSAPGCSIVIKLACAFFQMRPGLITTYAIMSLVSCYIITQHMTAASYEETVEKGKEHRREKLDEETSGVASNGGAIGWRRRRNIMGKLNHIRAVPLSLRVRGKCSRENWGREANLVPSFRAAIFPLAVQ